MTGGTILLMAAHEQGSLRLAAALRRRGLGVLEPRDPSEALALARAVRPTVAVLDLRSTGLTFVIDRLYADARCGRPAVMLLVPEGVTPVRSLVPQEEAEIVEWDPAAPGEVVGKLVATADRQRELRAASPLTGLPGNAAIRAEVERRCAAGRPFALLYIDLDAFKPYNDRYGFLRGDDVLRMLASVLVTEARRHPDAFVGHVGGDDFVVLLTPESAELAARRITGAFEAAVPQFYEAHDAARGWVSGHDRLGRRCRWPLLSLSIGVARSDRRAVTNALELVDIATEMKQVAKRTRGSALAVDQRSSGHPPPGWRVRALATTAGTSLRRVAAVAVATVLAAALFVPAGGALALAKPGEMLWPAARLIEDARLALAGTESSVSLRFEIAAARLADALTAVGLGDEEQAEAALWEYRRRHREAIAHLARVEPRDRTGELATLIYSHDQQAQALSGFVEARCERGSSSQRSCVALRAALAAVTSPVPRYTPPASAGSLVAPPPSTTSPPAGGPGQGATVTVPPGTGPAATAGAGGQPAPAPPVHEDPAVDRSGAAEDRSAPGTPAATSVPPPGGDGADPATAAEDVPSPATPSPSPSPPPEATPPDTPAQGPPPGTPPAGPPASPPGPPETPGAGRDRGQSPPGTRDGWNEARPGAPPDDGGTAPATAPSEADAGESPP
jgi:GGDEF domain-containing protein